MFIIYVITHVMNEFEPKNQYRIRDVSCCVEQVHSKFHIKIVKKKWS